MAELFVKNFDCKNEKHVMWLKDVGAGMAKISAGEKYDIAKHVNNNPIKGNPKMGNPMDWAYIHFQLAMKYTNAVLNGDAFIPSNKTEVLFEGEVSRV
jgi:replication-associated recombination protein RarA